MQLNFIIIIRGIRLKDNLCDKCLNDCKAIRPISICHSYNNPNWRQIDTRCRICNKKIPHYHKLCNEHNAWGLLLQKTFGIGGMFGLIPKMRDIIKRVRD